MTRRSIFRIFLPQTAVSWHQIGNRGDAGPTRFGMGAGPAPPDTVVDGIAHDCVIYLDSADNKLKVRKLDGSVVVLG